MMGFIKDVIANIETSRNLSEYHKAHQKAVAHSLLLELLFNSKGPDSINVKHPLHELRLNEFKQRIHSLKNKKGLCVNFGDSLTDLTRKWIDSIDVICSVAGMWHYHMAQMADDVKVEISKCNIGVDHVVVGCLGGNPLLVYQNLNDTVKNSINALDKIKANFPNAKFLVYGLPPTYNINVAESTYSFDATLLGWCKLNQGVFISLKHLGSFFGIFAKTRWSNDGIHFTPKAARRFSKAVEKAKSAQHGSVVYA